MIGNSTSGTVDIDAKTFVGLILGNMDQGAMPGAIYISTCAKEIANFAGLVALTSEAKAAWKGLWVFGHNAPVVGKVPGPKEVAWSSVQITS
jgi:hypothetical protein